MRGDRGEGEDVNDDSRAIDGQGDEVLKFALPSFFASPSFPPGTSWLVAYKGKQADCEHHYPGEPHWPCWDVEKVTHE